MDVPHLSITPWSTSAPAASRILHWWDELPRANCAVRQFAPRSHIRKVVPSRERTTRQNGPPASSTVLSFALLAEMTSTSLAMIAKGLLTHWRGKGAVDEAHETG